MVDERLQSPVRVRVDLCGRSEAHWMSCGVSGSTRLAGERVRARPTVGAEVVPVKLAELALFAVDSSLDCNAVSDLDVRDAFSDGHDLSS